MTNVFFYTGLIIFSVIISLWTFLKNEKKWSALWFYFFAAVFFIWQLLSTGIA